MKIAINTLAHRTSGGGITYLKNILPRLAETNHNFVVFVPEGRNALQEPSAPNIKFRRVSLPMTMMLILVLYEQLVLPYQLRKLDVDVLYCPADIAPLLASCPIVLAVRNPNPYFTERVHSGLLRLKFLIQRGLTKLSARIADRVLFVSDFSRDIVRDQLSITASKCETIHHGIDPQALRDCDPDSSSVKGLLEERAPYVLSVSTIHRHKNYHNLIQAYAALSPSVRSQYPLVIVGRPADEQYYEELTTLVSDYGLADDIVFAGEVPYEDVGCLYRGAAAYVLPSKLETFGHTLLEAMVFDVPVLAADSTAIPEIADDAALYFSPNDPKDLETKLMQVLNDKELINRLVTNGTERLKHFSWDRNVEQLVAAFESAGEER